MTFTQTFAHAQAVSKIQHALVYMSTLQLLDDDEHAALEKLLDTIHQTEHVAREHESRIRSHADDAAQKLLDSKVAFGYEAVAKSAAQLCTQEHVDAIAEAVFRAALKRANVLVAGKSGQLANAIDEQLQMLAAKVRELEPELAGITNADSAIAADKADAWKRVGELADTYSELSKWVSSAREDGLIARPKNQNEVGSHWHYRKPALPAQATLVRDDGDKRTRLFATLRREPYVPVSVDQAEETRRQWTVAA